MDIKVKLKQMTKIGKMQMYMMSMRSALNTKALFSDGTEEFVSPAQPMPGDKVIIRFRTLKNNVDHVYLLYGEECQELFVKRSMGSFDYYATEVTVGEEMLSYCFKIISGKLECYYNQRGPMRNREPYYDFRLLPGYKTPDWAKGAVFYQIFVDRFNKGEDKDCIWNKVWLSDLMAELDRKALLVRFFPYIHVHQSFLYGRQPLPCRQQDIRTVLITRCHMGTVYIQHEGNDLWKAVHKCRFFRFYHTDDLPDRHGIPCDRRTKKGAKRFCLHSNFHDSQAEWQLAGCYFQHYICLHRS